MAIANPVAGYQPLLTLVDLPVPANSPPDDRSGSSYLAQGDLVLATEIALATGRPLLLRGAPGSGKSSWASYVARNLGWRYHELVVTSNTELSDFYYRFDAVRRLQDAQRGKEGGDLSPARYVWPGPMWLAFQWNDAINHPASRTPAENQLALGTLNQDRDGRRAVVLVDELDKADPGLPNGLLDAIASRRFTIEPLDGKSVSKSRPDDGTAQSVAGVPVECAQPKVNAIADLQIIFTTNEERDLPEAFLRRCIVHALPAPDAERLQEIAWLRRRPQDPARSERANDEKTWRAAVRLFAHVTAEAAKQAEAREVRGPSTAEFLDLVAAWERIGFEVEGAALVRALDSTFRKSAAAGIDSNTALAAGQQAAASIAR